MTKRLKHDYMVSAFPKLIQGFPLIEESKAFSTNISPKRTILRLGKETNYSTIDELRVKQLNVWEQENLNFKSEEYDSLYSYLLNYYMKEKITSKIKELEELEKIKKNSANFNKSFHNVAPTTANKALYNIYLKSKQEEGTILLNSISKTSARFNYELITTKTQRQIQSDFQIDMSSLNAVNTLKSRIQEEEKQEDKNYYRKIISEKAQKESVLRDALLKLSQKIREKKNEKKIIQSKLDNLYAKRTKKEEDYSKEKMKLENLKISNIVQYKKKKHNKVNQDEAFNFMLQSHAHDNAIEEKLNEIKRQFEIFFIEYSEEKEKLLRLLNILTKEEELLKCVYHYIIKEQRQYYFTILRNGYDVRDDGLVWVVKHLLEMNTLVEYHHFPKFLDNQQIDYLLSQAQLSLQETVVTLLYQGMKNRQDKYKNTDRSTIKRFTELKKTISPYYNNKLGKNMVLLTNGTKLKKKSYMDLHLSNTFEGLKIKYSRVFRGQAQTQGDEVNLQNCIEELKEQLISGNYQINNNQNILNHFLESNTENKIELEMILELREKMKKIKMAREKAKKEMIEELKMKRNQDGIQMNAKLSLRNDLVFSALFGSNFSL